MQEAMGNVVHNALKFTENGYITIHTRAENGHAIVDVEDTGRGMCPETVKQLFSRDQVFSGPPTPESGTGLGLYVARQFMLAQQGDVSATSEVGRGSRFTIRVPLYQKETTKGVTHESVPQSISTAGRR